MFEELIPTNHFFSIWGHVRLTVKTSCCCGLLNRVMLQDLMLSQTYITVQKLGISDAGYDFFAASYIWGFPAPSFRFAFLQPMEPEAWEMFGQSNVFFFFVHNIFAWSRQEELVFCICIYMHTTMCMLSLLYVFVVCLRLFLPQFRTLLPTGGERRSLSVIPVSSFGLYLHTHCCDRCQFCLEPLFMLSGRPQCLLYISNLAPNLLLQQHEGDVPANKVILTPWRCFLKY